MIYRYAKKMFDPAVSFMGRRSYAQKFAVVGILLTTPLVVAFSVVVQNEYRHIYVEQQKVVGIKYINSLSILLRNVQQHRGMSSAILAGDTKFIQKRVEHAENITQNLEALSSFDATLFKDGGTGGGGGSLGHISRVRELISAWGALQEKLDVANTAEESFTLHTVYTQTIISLMKEAGDASGLFLGDEPIDYYLAEMAVVTLPEMSENIGQSRAYGVGIQHGRKLTEEEKQRFAVFLATADRYVNKLDREVAFVVRERPSLAPSLSGMLNTSKIALGTLMSTYRKEFIESDDGRMMSNEVYWRITTSAVDTILNTYNSLLHTYSAVSDININVLERERNVIFALIIASFSLAAYLFIGFYVVFWRTVVSIGQTTKKVLSGASGEHHIDASTRDELGEIARSFNEIMDAFLATNKDLMQSNSSLVMRATKQKEVEEKLKERALEVDKFNRLMVGRELKMVELKEEILALKEQLANR